MSNDAIARPVRFTSEDCQAFGRNTNAGSWTNVAPTDQATVRDVRQRLLGLATLATERLASSVAMRPFVSVLNPNGRMPRDMWCCVYPERIPNKSFGLQAALIISGTGAELCFCLGAGSAQVQSPTEREAFREALLHTQARLRAVGLETWTRMLTALGDTWSFRRSWRQPTPDGDFSRLEDWVQFASSTNGNGASISRNLTVQELDDLGEGIEELFLRFVRAAAPVFEAIYEEPRFLTEPLAAARPVPTDRLAPALRVKLLEAYQSLLSAGELPSREKLAGYYDSFRQRFQPSILQHLDGESLLDVMHNFSNRNSLVYWLEFKADDEFPPIFGSIAGGSALKFGLYKRKDSGAWMTGSSLAQRELDPAEAIAMAREHLRQLAAGERVLRQLPAHASDEDYAALQRALEEAAPDLCDLAWSHKYWSLLFPQVLDDFHIEQYQRFHLLKLLQTPPDARGRFVMAGAFTAIARELELPLKHLTLVLHQVNGAPHRYWRIGTSDGTSERKHWKEMVERGAIAIGWSSLGDLQPVLATEDPKSAIRDRLAQHYPADPRLIGRLTQQILNFCRLERHDIVVAANGSTVLGIARVKDDYHFDGRFDFPHLRSVDWLDIHDWKLPYAKEGLRTTLFELRHQPENIVAIERRLLEPRAATPIEPRQPLGVPHRRVALTDVPPLSQPGERVRRVLLRKSQAILHGPPGTGKTFWAERVARHIASWTAFGSDFERLSTSEQQRIVGTIDQPGLVRACTFHPGYGYEDFIEGFRPEEAHNGMTFRRRPGIFKRLCDDAKANPQLIHVLIVDEINRGDLPRIFGELLTVIEQSRRGAIVELSLTGERFFVPSNVLLIGTMNTADRSIALLDAAFRRRFGFVEMLPEPSALRSARAGTLPLGAWLTALNRRLVEHTGRDARSLQVGHAYLMPLGTPVQDLGEFVQILEEDILPLLQEYCYDDWETLEKILGTSLVSASQQRIRADLLSEARRDDLVQALLSMDVDTTAVEEMDAIASDTQPDDADQLDEDDEQEP